VIFQSKQVLTNNMKAKESKKFGIQLTNSLLLVKYKYKHYRS